MRPSRICPSAFDTALPLLREIRNPLTHPNDNDLLDDVAWFSAIVRLGDRGEVTYLIDPRYGQHDAAMRYAHVLQDFLRGQLH